MLKTNRRTGKISLRNLDQVEGGKSSSAIYAKKMTILLVQEQGKQVR